MSLVVEVCWCLFCFWGGGRVFVLVRGRGFFDGIGPRNPNSKITYFSTRNTFELLPIRAFKYEHDRVYFAHFSIK